MIKQVYLDHHTRASPFPGLLEKMLKLVQEHARSSLVSSQRGYDLSATLHKSLVRLYENFGAKEEDTFIFSPTINNSVEKILLTTYAEIVRQTGRNQFLTTVVEETPILKGMKRFEEMGVISRKLSVNAQGQLTKQSLEEALNPRVALVSLSWACGLTGVIQPIADLIEVCRKNDILVHVDASYVIGKLFFRFQDLDVDFLSFHGDPLHMLPGAGGFFVKKQLAALFESHLNYSHAPGIITLSDALDQVHTHFDHLATETARLKELFEKRILEEIPDAVIFFQDAERLPTCTAIAFPGVASDALLFALYRKGVYATKGGDRFQPLFDVLVASGIPPLIARSALSFSFSLETSEEEIETAIQMLVELVKKMRVYSNKIMEKNT